MLARFRRHVSAVALKVAKTLALDGSGSRTIIVLTCIACATALCWHKTIDGQAMVGLLSLIVGGAVHASGTKQGSEASVAPPAAD